MPGALVGNRSVVANHPAGAENQEVALARPRPDARLAEGVGLGL